MAFGSGLAAQVGFAAESSYGTLATVDHFFDHDTADLDLDQGWAQGEGLHAGGQVRRGVRTVQTTRDASGPVEMDIPTRKFGLLVRHMLGSTVSAPTLIAGSAYKQIHALGNAAGLSLTTQVGVPRVDGTVEPYTYPGCKIAGWKITCEQGGLLKVELDINAKDELTTATTPAGPALAAASYVAAAEVFNFAQVSTFKIGGTPSTASGEVTIAGGVSVATLVRGFSLEHKTPLADSRYGISATKSEQLQNGYSEPTLSLDAEFATRTEFYDIFRAGTAFAVQLDFQGSIISGTDRNLFSIILPHCKIKSDKVAGNGQDLTNQPLEIEVLDDGTNTPLQIKLQSADSTL